MVDQVKVKLFVVPKSMSRMNYEEYEKGKDDPSDQNKKLY